MILAFIIAVSWPLAPADSTHPLGNNWGEYQDYGGSPYLHPGIDVMADTIHRPVYAVQSGVVKAWLTISGDWHWRLAIADYETNDSVEAWLYAHIDPDQFHKNIGDTVAEGELIGYLVEWPVTGFDHLHFARIKDAGPVWQYADWAFIQNPLVIIAPYDDTTRPVFENSYYGNKFAFCQNNSSSYLESDSLHGSVDIIAKIYDEMGLPLYNPVWERLIPFKIEYEIHGLQNMPRSLSFIFHGVLDYTNNVNVIFKDDAICNTQGDYSSRDYYFIVTNTDGDSIVEASDAAFAWQTTDFPDGQYWVIVNAYDAANNQQSDSMLVEVANVGIAEQQKNNAAVAGLRISPNPNPGYFTIDSEALCHIVDISGRVIASGRRNFGKLSPGVYFVIFEEDNEIHHQKIIVVQK